MANSNIDVTVKVRPNGDGSAIATVKTKMTNDLPWDALGEIVGRAISEAVDNGAKPKEFHVVVSFE